MKEINIASIVTQKRKEKGITQDELAYFIGVSKASVSKWETGQSYPDIVLLPQLATYFNISIDELMGYSPQMTRDDIKKLYHNLSSEFATVPFDSVYSKCEDIIKKYYSCFPLILQMAILLMNHHILCPDVERQKSILEEAVELLKRVEKESEVIWETKEAVLLRGTCYLAMQRPEEVLDLLGETIRPIPQDTEILAMAYQQMGNIEKANRAIQISTYQHLLFVLSSAPQLMSMNSHDPEKVEEIVRRTLIIGDLFHVEDLHPNTMAIFHLSAAQIYCTIGNNKRALEFLQHYADIASTKFFPFSLHGDKYFDAIEDWLDGFELGSQPPRNEQIIRNSIIQGISENPVFHVLKDNPEFKNIVVNLKKALGVS